MRLNIKNIVSVLKTMREYLFPLRKITNKFKSINTKEDLQNFIQERSAHVTQTTLSVGDTKNIVSILKNKYPEIEEPA